MAETQMASWYALLKKGLNSKPKFTMHNLIAALDLSNKNANTVLALKNNTIKINLADLSKEGAEADLKKLAALEQALMAENENISRQDIRAPTSYLRVQDNGQTAYLQVSPALLTNPDMLRRILEHTTQSQDLKNQVKESMQHDVKKSYSSLIFSQTMLGVSIAGLVCAGAVLAAPFILPIAGAAVVVVAAAAAIAAATVAVTGAAFSVSDKSIKHQAILKERIISKETTTAALQQNLNSSGIELAYNKLQEDKSEASQHKAADATLPDQQIKTTNNKKSMTEQVRNAQTKNKRSLSL